MLVCDNNYFTPGPNEVLCHTHTYAAHSAATAALSNSALGCGADGCRRGADGGAGLKLIVRQAETSREGRVSHGIVFCLRHHGATRRGLHFARKERSLN